MEFRICKYFLSGACPDAERMILNVLYDCKAEPADAGALYMQIGGSGYEEVISLPKIITLEECETTDPRLLE